MFLLKPIIRKLQNNNEYRQNSNFQSFTQEALKPKKHEILTEIVMYVHYNVSKNVIQCYRSNIIEKANSTNANSKYQKLMMNFGNF